MSLGPIGYVFAGTLALTVAVGAAQSASPSQQTPAQQPVAEAPGAQGQVSTVTVEGCLVVDQDEPGRPTADERAGIAGDYQLTKAVLVTATGPLPADGRAAPANTPTGTSGTQASLTYEVEGMDKDQLRQHVGRRVQIDGTLRNVERARANLETQTPPDNFVELRGVTIRTVPGNCASK